MQRIREMNEQISFDQFFSGPPAQPVMAREDYLPPRSKVGQLSSQRAEEDLKRSGVLKGQLLLTLQAMNQHPGKSTKQVAELTGLDRHMLGRRAGELEKLRLARRESVGSADAIWYAI